MAGEHRFAEWPMWLGPSLSNTVCTYSKYQCTFKKFIDNWTQNEAYFCVKRFEMHVRFFFSLHTFACTLGESCERECQTSWYSFKLTSSFHVFPWIIWNSACAYPKSDFHINIVISATQVSEPFPVNNFVTNQTLSTRESGRLKAISYTVGKCAVHNVFVSLTKVKQSMTCVPQSMASLT